jgi:hypothetical protein
MSVDVLRNGNRGRAEPIVAGLGAERLFLALGALLYLWVFATVVPSGDGLVYAWHIDAADVWLNPNHLLMDPVGYAFCKLLWGLGLPIETLDALKLISALSTVATLLLFHAVLIAAGVGSRWVRLSAVVGLFASRNFLTMAISEEFFMLQMPLLTAALLLLVKLELSQYAKSWVPAAMLGALLGIATAVTINNVLLGVVVVLWLFFSAPDRHQGLLRTSSTAIGAVVVTLPMFVIAYAASDTDGFIHWLVAYQGSEGEGSPGSLYGISLTPAGIATSFARLALNSFTNLLSIGYLGTMMKSLVFGAPLEIAPQPLRFVLGVVLLLTAVAAVLLLAWWMLRNFREQRLVRVALVWLAAYYGFNFFWDDSSDQFWFQILPPLWLLIALFAQAGLAQSELTRSGSAQSGLSQSGANPLATSAVTRQSGLWLLFVLAPTLLLANTLQEVAPKAFQDIEAHAAQHRALLREGDLEIIPGWDDVRWIGLDGSNPRITQVNLMTTAMLPASNPGHIATLFPAVESHLKAGGRVIIARVYDKDQDPRPWDQLRKLGWSREKLQQQFSRYEVRPLATIGDTVFRELRLKDEAARATQNQ